MLFHRHLLSLTLLLSLAGVPEAFGAEALLLVKREGTSLRLVYQLGDSELAASPESSYQSWQPFELRGSFRLLLGFRQCRFR